MTDWMSATAADQGRAIARGDLDPLELAEASLEAARQREDIYARLTEDRAMIEAQAARDRARQNCRLSPLDGVSVSWKDLFDTAGVATEAGSRLLEGRTPDSDATVLGSATQMGLVCVGKTHMSELAFSGLGLNPMTGTPPNVNDADAIPGGSSSGAAASVAFDTVAAGIGSDTGGSVRIPAAWNDLVGLKTTSGLLSLKGVVPLCARFDTVGPLARSVEDAALLLEAMGGPKAPDLHGATLRGKRFAVLETAALEGIEAGPRDALTAAVGCLEAAGASVEPLSVPALEEAMALSAILFTSEAYGTWKEVIEDAPEKMFPEVRERFRSGADHKAADFVAAWQMIDRVRSVWTEAVAGYDAVLSATCPILPPKRHLVETDSDTYKRANLMTLRNTRIGNLMGLSALTLPTGKPSCGLQVLGRPMGEAALLRLGAAMESALA